MAEVKCWAIGVDEVREMFSASPAIKERLLTLAQSTYAPKPEPVPQLGLLGKLGPLLRRPPDAPVISPETPTPLDASTLVEGRFVPQARLAASWRLVQHWLDELAWDHAAWSLTEHQLDALDFDLARAGVVSKHGVRGLWARDVRLPLRPQAGAEVGYQRHDNVIRLRDDWARALPQLVGDSPRTSPPLVGDSAPTAHDVVTFLTRLDGFAEKASGAGRPTPDVVTLRTR